mmetsp:Transcript_27761/g.95533  ORF Transcript_27761/g.95533 Transcript_27761/m.95533 type:complete len:210 (+) Transcript_27761:514-1143(+)
MARCASCTGWNDPGTTAMGVACARAAAADRKSACASPSLGAGWRSSARLTSRRGSTPASRTTSSESSAPARRKTSRHNRPCASPAASASAAETARSCSPRETRTTPPSLPPSLPPSAPGTPAKRRRRVSRLPSAPSAQIHASLVRPSRSPSPAPRTAQQPRPMTTPLGSEKWCPSGRSSSSSSPSRARSAWRPTSAARIVSARARANSA